MIIWELALFQRRTPLREWGAGGAGRGGALLNRGVTSFKNSTLHRSNRYSSSSVGGRAGGHGGCETCLTTEINNGTKRKQIQIERKEDRGEIKSHSATASESWCFDFFFTCKCWAFGPEYLANLLPVSKTVLMFRACVNVSLASSTSWRYFCASRDF